MLKKMHRMQLHVHTKYSHDSILSFFLLYMKCLLSKIDYIAITEHNNIDGAIAFKNYCKKRGDKVHVIIGEEIMTTEGEIIGLFLNKSIPKGLSPKETINEIKKQNGIIYIPHPYDEKRKKTVLKEIYIKKFRDSIDYIECHNGRNVSLDFSIRQSKIAEKYNLEKIIGSDAHTVFEIGRNIIETPMKPNTPELFKIAIENSNFFPNKCLKFCHQLTKIAKGINLLKRGDTYELCRIIYKKFRPNQ